MRTIVLTVGLITAALLAVAVLRYRQVTPPPLPPIGPGVEQICVETMQRSAPDLSWAVQGYEEKVRGREVKTVTIGELPFHLEGLVRVAGVLHMEFEWIALHPSRAAMEGRWGAAPWVNFGSLWGYEPYWRTKAPTISDRCVIVEGTYSGPPGGASEMFNGTLHDVLRLDVWSSPHRPFNSTPPPPPPPPPLPPGER